MTWKAMTAEHLVDVIRFWDATPWPLTRVEAYQRAAALGWTVRAADGMLENPVDAFSFPTVQVSVVKDPERVATVSFWASDVVRDPSEDDVSRLNDDFTAAVRAGGAHWGEPQLGGGRDRSSAQWELESGARVILTRSTDDITVSYDTPDYAEILRELGE